MAEQIQHAPHAKTVPFTFEHLGKHYEDHYTWLQDKNDPEVIAYLEAENAYAKANLKHTEALQETLFQEMKGRIQEDDSTVPARRGDYLYYWRVEAGQQYRLYCRKHTDENAEEEILIDENALAEGLDYCKIYLTKPSPDNNFLAYAVDTTGALVFELCVLDLRSGELVSGPIKNTAWSIAWASDNKTLFYTLFDDAHRAYQLMRHTVGDDPQNDALIYQEDDDAFGLGIGRTRSGAYLVMTLSSHSTSEVHVLAADTPSADFKLVHPRQHWMEYYLDHHGERFLIYTNDEAENFKLMEAPLDDPSKANWKTLIPHRSDVFIQSVEPFQDTIVLDVRKDGLPQLCIYAPDDLSDGTYVQFPEASYALALDSNPEYSTNLLRFTYSSLITPQSTVDYDMNSGAWDVKKRQEIPSGYDPEQYETERIFAPASDGAQVPISLIYRKGLKRDGSAPLLQYGYGSYGYSRDASFSTSIFSLLDRGFVYAIAHIRGGSEMGRSWYEDGRLMNKKNTFTDFIACAEHLIAEGYTSSEKLSIMGGSAGGLLVSAVMNLRPDLFKSVVAMVPFTNVITAMLTPDLPLTVIEYEQWGNPNDQEAFDYMLSYSPYEHVEAKAYPHVYAKTGLNDLQVPYWDPAKWVARLRAHKTDQNKLIFVTNMGAGHRGASGRYDYLRETAEVYAFLIDTLEVSYETD